MRVFKRIMNGTWPGYFYKAVFSGRKEPISE
jgi:hypothetical protein